MHKPIPPLSEWAKQLKPGIYQHFKGDKMEVLGLALQSETLEEMVVYKHVTGEYAGETRYWVRPVKMFFENVEKDGYKGPRFKYEGPSVRDF